MVFRMKNTPKPWFFVRKHTKTMVLRYENTLKLAISPVVCRMQTHQNHGFRMKAHHDNGFSSGNTPKLVFFPYEYALKPWFFICMQAFGGGGGGKEGKREGGEGGTAKP